jgi:hypothetical protein
MKAVSFLIPGFMLACSVSAATSSTSSDPAQQFFRIGVKAAMPLLMRAVENIEKTDRRTYLTDELKELFSTRRLMVEFERVEQQFCAVPANKNDRDCDPNFQQLVRKTLALPSADSDSLSEKSEFRAGLAALSPLMLGTITALEREDRKSYDSDEILALSGSPRFADEYQKREAVFCAKPANGQLLLCAKNRQYRLTKQVM